MWDWLDGGDSGGDFFGGVSDWFGGGNDYTYDQPSYDYSYDQPSYDYSYDQPSYDYNYEQPSYDYNQPSYDYNQPSYDYNQPSYDYNEPTTYNQPVSYEYNPASGGYNANTGAQYFGGGDNGPVVWSDIQGQEVPLQGYGTTTGYDTSGRVSIEPAPEIFNNPNAPTIPMPSAPANEQDYGGAPVYDQSTPYSGGGYGNYDPGQVEIKGVGQNPAEGSQQGTGGQGGGTQGGQGGFFDNTMKWIKDNPLLAGAGTAGTVLALSKLFGGSAAGAPTGGGAPGGGGGGAPGGGGTAPGGGTITGPNGVPVSQNPITNPAMPAPGQPQTPITRTTPELPGQTTPPSTTTPGTPANPPGSGIPDWLWALGGAALWSQYGPGIMQPNQPTMSSPNYLDQFGKTGLSPGAGGGAYPGLSIGGLNPGWMQAGVPNYNPTMAQQAPAQNQYNWGTHPYMSQMGDLANYQQPGGPANTQIAGPVNPMPVPLPSPGLPPPQLMLNGQPPIQY